MSPGAVAAILYARCRLALRDFQLESEMAPSGRCFIATASWSHWDGGSRTYSAILALDVPDVAKLMGHVLARAAENIARNGS